MTKEEKSFGWSEPINGVLLQTFYQHQAWIEDSWQSGSDCGVSWSARVFVQCKSNSYPTL